VRVAKLTALVEHRIRFAIPVDGHQAVLYQYTQHTA